MMLEQQQLYSTLHQSNLHYTQLCVMEFPVSCVFTRPQTVNTTTVKLANTSSLVDGYMLGRSSFNTVVEWRSETDSSPECCRRFPVLCLGPVRCAHSSHTLTRLRTDILQSDSLRPWFHSTFTQCDMTWSCTAPVTTQYVGAERLNLSAETKVS